MSDNLRNIEDFKSFAKHTAQVRIPSNEKSYQNRYGRSISSLRRAFSKEELIDIIQAGDPQTIREVSRYYLRFCGEYAQMINYRSSLLSYAYMVVPHYDIKNPPKKLDSLYAKTSKQLKEANFDSLFPRINKTILSEGVFFGILKETEDHRIVFYRLPCQWCRSRFQDENDLHILEINLQYFDQVVSDEVERKQLLSLFPKYVQSRYKSRKDKNWWVEIPPSEGGICFSFNDEMIPPFISSAVAAEELQDARDREQERDDNELRKLLIQKLPIDKQNGELLFTLPEAAELHDSVCGMLAGQDSIDVLTTYADVKLESIQEADTAASASQSRLSKYTQNVYNEMGVSQEIFNASNGSTALTYSIKKDIAQMYSWSKQYEIWINTYLRRIGKTNCYFSIRILPSSTIFKKEDADMYLKTAQYGYPKTAVAAVMGIDTIDMIHLSDFENNILGLDTVMKPLNSSYTQTGEENSKNSEKIKTSSKKIQDITNEGGRPPLDESERSDRTQQNIEGMT